MTSRSEQTRNRIYQAALAEFARYGVAGARVDRIAREAQANKQAIYLYFGDKETLFSTVLERVLGELAAAVPPPTADGTVDVAEYLDRLFTYHQEHPEVTRLLLWEALEYGDRPVPDEESRRAHYQRKTAALDGVRTAASEQIAAIDAPTLLLIFTGLVGWPLGVPQVRRMIVGEGEDAMDRVKAAVIAAGVTIAGQK
ncbi:TetR/AcrR family transcriptional regulator [Kitasatospora brasiliensis]|uniref:TetR/AcrR family transcriptional regulator n=1 Tax=Kitasatospora brasiliensis TaxID=3058040 RepID=UPI00292EA620|nr:TetR family transcriptional regulator [Kitasatospora sp. K002]